MTNVLLVVPAPLPVGKSHQLTATVVPAQATNTAVSFTTSNPDILTVSPTGLLFAKATGTATVTVTTVDGGKSAVKTVTVGGISVRGITLSARSLQIRKSATATLVATISPATASNKIVSWTTNNSSVATVTDGVIKGIRPGTAIIRATTIEGFFSATCTVAVRP